MFKKIWKQQTFLGISFIEDRACLLYRERLFFFWHKLKALYTNDFPSFEDSAHTLSIYTQAGTLEEIHYCYNFSLYHHNNTYLLSYTRLTDEGPRLILAQPLGKDDWIVTLETDITKRGVLVSNYTYQGNSVLIHGETALTCSFIQDNRVRYTSTTPFITPHNYLFDKEGIRVIHAQYVQRKQEVVVFYDTYDAQQHKYFIGALILDALNLTKVLWRSEDPLAHISTKHKPYILGATIQSETAEIYISHKNRIQLISFPFPSTKLQTKKFISVYKHAHNPILTPRKENIFTWEKEGAFNPTALELDGTIHLLYRALSSEGLSSIGYASSKDGFTIDERLDKPVYVPRTPHEGVLGKVEPFSSASGGGWGGCEDPKITCIEDRIYLTYVAFNGTWPTRTALSSISVEDFKNRVWSWTQPALLSPELVDNKSLCLLPEKINGKYVIFHRVWPDILVDYVDDLDFSSSTRWLNCSPSVFPWKKNGKVVIRHGTWPNIREEITPFENENDLIQSSYWKDLTRNTLRITARPDNWDSHKISMGCSPIKTEYGWLALYSAVDKRDFSKYKMGAMLLDLEKPHKVLHRTDRPIIVPNEWYENEGKPGIVYPGGCVARGDDLFIYYGGGDKVSCVAHTSLQKFISDLCNPSKNTFSSFILEPLTL